MQSKSLTPTWKKVLIIALCLLGSAALILVGLMCKAYYDKNYKVTYWETWTTYVSPNIVMEHGHKGINRFEQLKDIRTGKYTTPRFNHIFINLYNHSDSLVVFRTFDNLRGYLNTHTGKIIIPAQYQRAWNFSEGIAAVYDEGLVSFINASGEPAFSSTFPLHYGLNFDDIAFQFHDGLCVMLTMDGKWGLINTQGEWVVNPIYNAMDAPYHGYRRVYDGDHYGLLTNDGSLALPVVYDDIHRELAGNGWILVKDGLACQVDFELQVTVPFVHDGIHTLSYIDSYDTNEYYDEASGEYKTRKLTEPRFFRFDIGCNSGVIDANGKVIIPALYYNVYIVNDRLFEVEVTSSGERLLYDTKGQYVGKSDFQTPLTPKNENP